MIKRYTVQGTLLFATPTKAKAADAQLRKANIPATRKKNAVVVSAQDVELSLSTLQTAAQKATLGRLDATPTDAPEITWIHAGGRLEHRLHQDDPHLHSRLGSDAFRLDAFPGYVSAAFAAVSPDGTWVAIGGDREHLLALFDFPTGDHITDLIGHKIHVDWGVWNPDSKVLYTGGGHEECVFRWELETGKVKTRTVKHITGLWLSPTSDVLLVGSVGDAVIVLNSTTLKPITTLDGHKKLARCGVAISSDGQHVVTSTAKGVIRRWDTSSWQPLGTVFTTPDNAEPTALAFVPDTATLLIQWAPGGTWYGDGTELNKVHALSLDTTPPVQVLDALPRGLDLSPDGQLASGFDYSTEISLEKPDVHPQIRVVELATGRTCCAVHATFNTRTGWHPSGEHLFIREGAAFLPYDPNTGGRRPGSQGHVGPISALRFSPDGQRLLTSGESDRCLRLQHLDGALQSELQIYGVSFHDIVWTRRSLNVRMGVGAGKEGIVWHLDPDTLERQGRLPATPSALGALALSEDGETLVWSGPDEHLRIASIDALDTPRTLLIPSSHGQVDSAIRLAFSPEGSHLVAMLVSGNTLIWSVDDLDAPPQHITPKSRFGRGLVMLPEVGIALATRSSRIEIWTLFGEHLTELPLPSEGVANIACSDRFLAATLPTTQRILLWDLTDFSAAPTTLQGHAASSLAFSSDGSLLASGGQRGDVVLWNV